MAQRPTFPNPYLSTIDADDDNDFVCLINERDVITAYTFTIYSTTNTTIDNAQEVYQEVYTVSGSIDDGSMSSPIYGGKGNDSYLIITVPSGTLTNRKIDSSTKLPVVTNHQVFSNGTTHTELSGEYKWQVSLTDSYGNTVISREYYFTCFKTPIISINNGVSEIITTASASFDGEYIATINDTNGTYYPTPRFIDYRFILYNSNNEIVKDTGYIYSQYIHFDYDMFVSGRYSLKLMTESEGNVKKETTLDFTVSYDNAPTVNVPKSSISKNDNSVIVDFSGTVNIPGTFVPNADFTQINVETDNYGVYIPQNTELYWQKREGLSDGLDIDKENFTVNLMLNLPYGKQGDILKLTDGTDELALTFDGYKLILNRNESTIAYKDIYTAQSLAMVESSKSIDSNIVYYFDFSEANSYNFSDSYKYVLQNPMNVGWWFIRITPSLIIAERVPSEVAANVE